MLFFRQNYYTIVNFINNDDINESEKDSTNSQNSCPYEEVEDKHEAIEIRMQNDLAAMIFEYWVH